MVNDATLDGDRAYLFEEGEYLVPIPLDLVRVKLWTAKLVPRVVVEARAPVKEHAVDCAASSHHFSRKDTRRFVADLGVGKRGKGSCAGLVGILAAPDCLRGVEATGGILDFAVLDDKHRL